jgi:hypothetical protein
MELERRRTICPGCDEEYPLACGACPACGTTSLQPSGGERFSVFVPQIPSVRQRAEICAYLEKLLDCPGGRTVVEAALEAGESRLVDDLDEAAANALAAALGRKHVQGVRVEPTRARRTPFPWAWLPGYLPVLAGLGLGLVTSIPVGAGVVAGVLVAIVAMEIRRRRMAKAAHASLAMPVIAGESLPGWRPVAKQLGSLLPTLPPPVRVLLGKLASTAAFVMDEYGEGSLPGDSALKVLEIGLRLARGATPAGADQRPAVAELSRLAEAAGRARAELEGLSASGGANNEQEQQRIADTLGQAARAALPAGS